VLGIGLVFLFAGSFIPPILPIFPWSLSGFSLQLAQGAEAAGAIATTAFLPLLATALWTVLFIGVALSRFQREEF
jgi:hypothetical protein